MPFNSLGEEIKIGGFYRLVGYHGNPIIRVDGFTEDTDRIDGVLVITEPGRIEDGIAEMDNSPAGVKVEPERLGEELAHQQILAVEMRFFNQLTERMGLIFGPVYCAQALVLYSSILTEKILANPPMYFSSLFGKTRRDAEKI